MLNHSKVVQILYNQLLTDVASSFDNIFCSNRYVGNVRVRTDQNECFHALALWIIFFRDKIIR